MQLMTFPLRTKSWALRKLLYAAGSGDPQPLLHFFKRNSFGFRVHKQDHEKLQAHHQGEKNERISAGRRGQKRENSGDKGIHEPMRKAAQTLTSSPYAIRKDLTDEHPDNRALGKREERYIPNQQPDQKILVTTSKKDGCNASEAGRSPYRTD